MAIIAVIVAVILLLVAGSWLGNLLRKSGVQAVEDMKRQHSASILTDATAAKLEIDVGVGRQIAKIPLKSKEELEDEVNQ